MSRGLLALGLVAALGVACARKPEGRDAPAPRAEAGAPGPAATPGDTDELVVDPFCGVKLKRSEAAASAEYGGTTYWFCLADHRDAFLEDPETALRRRRASWSDAVP
jgi:YHS domain-containing protein